MKLYKFDINDMIIELEVVKETPTSYKYKVLRKYASNQIDIVKKDKVDIALSNITHLNLYKLVATSKKKLIDIAVQSLNDSINVKRLHIKIFEDKINNVINQMKYYDKDMEA